MRAQKLKEAKERKIYDKVDNIKRDRILHLIILT
jgi:hypothetical protein